MTAFAKFKDGFFYPNYDQLTHIKVHKIIYYSPFHNKAQRSW